MSVYLFRINDRPYGFRVVAVVALTESAARERCREHFGAQVTHPYEPNYPVLRDKCVAEVGAFISMTFEE